MPLRVSCPYCNTGFTLPEVPASGRASCPRCGDAFAVRGRVEQVEPGDRGQTTDDRRQQQTSPRRSSAGRVIGLLVAVGVILTGIGLSAYRHWRATPQPGPDAGPPGGVTPPAELRGLGFLPPDCNLAAAVQLSPVLGYADRTDQDPRDLLTKAGVPLTVLTTLDRIGIPLAGIDHIAAGALVPDPDGPPPRVALALVLRRPLADEHHFLDHLKARRSADGAKGLYDVELAGVPIPLRLAKATDTVWVVGFGWPEANRELGSTPLAAGLREVLTDQLPPTAAAWVAAAPGRWADKPLVRLLAGQSGRKEWLPALRQGQGAAAGLTLDAPPQLRVAVRGADAETGDRLRGYFREKVPGAGTRVGGAGEWATLDAPTYPPGGAAMVRSFLDDVGK